MRRKQSHASRRTTGDPSLPGVGGHLPVIPDPDGPDDRGQSCTLIGGSSYEILHERWPSHGDGLAVSASLPVGGACPRAR